MKTVALASTGKLSPSNLSMLDDIATVCTAATKLVESGKKVVMVMHSGGGFIGSNAIEGLGISARGEAKGGIIKLVFLAAAVFPEGFKHSPLPFFTIDVRLTASTLVHGAHKPIGWYAALQISRDSSLQRSRPCFC